MKIQRPKERLLVFLAFFVIACKHGNQQKKQIDPFPDNFLERIKHDDSIIQSGGNFIYKDSTGNIIPDSIAQEMLWSGNYEPWYAGIDIILYQKEKKAEYLNDKPPVATGFNLDETFPRINTADVLGKNIDIAKKDFKVIVINFWFIKCSPCRNEIPHLNALVKEYEIHKDVLFLGIGLDSKKEIQSFLRNVPFSYRLLSDGFKINPTPKVESFPTHVILNEKGKIVFSCAESSRRAIWWIKHTIDSCLNAN